MAAGSTVEFRRGVRLAFLEDVERAYSAAWRLPDLVARVARLERRGPGEESQRELAELLPRLGLRAAAAGLPFPGCHAGRFQPSPAQLEGAHEVVLLAPGLIATRTALASRAVADIWARDPAARAGGGVLRAAALVTLGPAHGTCPALAYDYTAVPRSV